MNNQEKFKKLKVHSKFTNDIVSRQVFHRYWSQQQHSLSSFLWFLFIFLFLLQFLLLFVCVCVFFKQIINVLVHIRLCGRVSDKKIAFFWPNSSYETFHFFILNLHQHRNFRTLPADLFKNFNTTPPPPQAGGLCATRGLQLQNLCLYSHSV